MYMCILLFAFSDFSFVDLPLVLCYCWLGLLTCKNRLPHNLYCVGGDVKHCTIQSNRFSSLLLIIIIIYYYYFCWSLKTQHISAWKATHTSNHLSQRHVPPIHPDSAPTTALHKSFYLFTCSVADDSAICVCAVSDVGDLGDSERWEEKVEDGRRDLWAGRLFVQRRCLCTVSRPQHRCGRRASAMPGWLLATTLERLSFLSVCFVWLELINFSAQFRSLLWNIFLCA